MTPEPVVDKLARFTPSASSLDPADVLFRAGQASARTPWGWKAGVSGLSLVVAVLLAERCVTNRPARPGSQDVGPIVAVAPAPTPAPDPSPSPSPGDPESPWRLGALLHATDPNDLPTSPALAGLSPADPPLTPASREID